jgi:hypothetical protein
LEVEFYSAVECQVELFLHHGFSYDAGDYFTWIRGVEFFSALVLNKRTHGLNPKTGGHMLLLSYGGGVNE